MATINQIRKQIESANNRIDSFRSKVEMYEGRIASAISKATKATGIQGITVENYDQVLGRDNWEYSYKIGNAIGYRNDNQKWLAREIRNIEGLKAELAKMEQAAADKEQATAPLKAALTVAMVDFRKVWFDRMNEWYSEHYDFVTSKYEESKAIRERINKIERTYFYSYCDIRRHSSIYYKMEAKRTAAIEVITDDANRMEKSEYMAKMNEMLAKQWENGIDKLADKCRTFGVDESKVETSAPRVTSKGFEVTLKDGKNRIIDARVIWAAEYSDIVTPHTRYIVTERRN